MWGLRMTNTSDKKVMDAVLPIFLGKWDGDDFQYKTVTGTTFLIGKRGFALTAAHVIDQIEVSGDDYAFGFLSDTFHWRAGRINSWEKHPTEDVAILKLSHAICPSWLVIQPEPQHQSSVYDSWGYPISVAEQPKIYEENGQDRPELIYTNGYVRRRISRKLPISIYRGTSFYELSEIAGDGCSGGPVIQKSTVGRLTWSVFGVYIGAAAGDFKSSYAVRCEAFSEWTPSLLTRSILEESQDR